MLTRGFKNEAQKKLDQVLKAGLKLTFAPDLWQSTERAKLDALLQKTLQVSLTEVEEMSASALLKQMKSLQFSDTNGEYVADLLLKTASLETGYTANLAAKALEIYESVQRESQTFSYGMIQKIKEAKALSA